VRGKSSSPAAASLQKLLVSVGTRRRSPLCREASCTACCCVALQGVQQPLTVSWADPERRAQLKRKFAGEPEPERQVPSNQLPPTCHTTNPKLYTLHTEVRHATDKHRMCLWNPAFCVSTADPSLHKASQQTSALIRQCRTACQPPAGVLRQGAARGNGGGCDGAVRRPGRRGGRGPVQGLRRAAPQGVN
jgi:hypothetical protein